MGVVHEGAAVLQHELVDEGPARRDMRLGQASNAVHTIWQPHAVPMDSGVLRKFVGDEDANSVAFDGLDRGSRTLAVIAPKVRLHPRSDLAHHRLGDEMELFPLAVHAPRQGPTIQGHHRLVVLSVRGRERRLHCGRAVGRRLGYGCGLRTPADHRCARQHYGRACEEIASRIHDDCPSVDYWLARAALMAEKLSLLLLRPPPPTVATPRSVWAIQKSRLASMPLMVAVISSRDSVTSPKTSMSIELNWSWAWSKAACRSGSTSRR